MEIRHTKPADMDAVLALYDAARCFMAENGNPDQWVNGYPGADQLSLDMASGSWLNDRPYGVVHRITSAPGTRGVASFCLAWCFAQCGNIRIDTHRNNIPMQKTLIKNGYRVCGTIYLENGDERIAFQKEQEN